MPIGRPPEYDRAQVLDAATAVFWRQGYQATSMQDLLEAMSLSKSSLYKGFESKRNLFLRCLERYQQKTVADFERSLQAAPSGLQFIVGRLNWVVDEALTSGDPQGCLVMNTATEFAQRDRIVATSVAIGLEHYREIFLNALQQSQREGGIPKHKDAELLASFLVTSMSGLRTMVKAGTDITTLRGMVAVIIGALS